MARLAKVTEAGQIPMFDHATLVAFLGVVTLAAPSALVLVLGASALLKLRLGETVVSRLCQVTILAGLLAAVSILLLMLIDGTRQETLEFGQWVAIPDYELTVKLVFDRLSVPYAILSFVLCGTISVFAHSYMHRDDGFNRFFVLYALFVLGIVLTSLAGTIETLFSGWELVGLSSVLLVAFFQRRPAPARNGLAVWIAYRVADVALLLAAIVMHHLHGHGDFNQLLGARPWPENHAAVTGTPALIVGLLLVVAAAGKSALVPFSGWLPRAMEGPTPSSAIFYGALSVHLGAFLLLRVSPLIDTSMFLSAVIVSVGLATALFAYLVGAVQPDVKAALSYASLVQVGLIVAEIGLGFRYVALVHLLGNACLRTLQFVRAPTLLHDYHHLENALGDHLPRATGPSSLVPGHLKSWLYRYALERGYLDLWLMRYVVGPFIGIFQACDACERRWTDFLAGRSPGDVAAARHAGGNMEELL